MADDKELINQDEIERLLQSTSGAAPGKPPASPAAQSANEPLGQSEIESLLNKGSPASSPAAGTAVADADKLLAQDDIEKLLSGAGRAAPAPKPPPPAKEKPAGSFAAESDITQSDVEFLLNQATKALESIDVAVGGPPTGVASFRFQEFGGAPANTEAATLDLISDVELDLRIELGRTDMYLEDVLKLRRGSVVPLDKLAGDPVDIYVNGRLIARGEVLVLNDNFCVRVAELIAGASPE